MNEKDAAYTTRLQEFHRSLNIGAKQERIAAVGEFVGWAMEPYVIKGKTKEGPTLVDVFRLIMPNGTQIELYKEYFSTEESARHVMEKLVAETYGLGKLFK